MNYSRLDAAGPSTSSVSAPRRLSDEVGPSESLHHRQLRAYENHTPETRSVIEAEEEQSKYKAEDDGYRISEDLELLPRTSASHAESSLAPASGYDQRASASSLGLASAHNGFSSRDEDAGTPIGTPNTRHRRTGSDNASIEKKRSRKDRDRERTVKFAREMIFVTVPSILLSMVGSVLAGEVLAKLKTWPVFLRVEELFILVPILLNLKGNLEMNLAARFSTSANIGELDLKQTRRSLVLGNMALLQVQALLVSLLAGIVAFVLGLMSRTGLTEHTPSKLAGNDVSAYGIQRGGYFECVMVLCASMIAASASSAVVGAFMCSLVVVSRFLRINPDNLATPLAASLGDLLALVILAIVANAGAAVIGSWFSTFVFLFLLAFIAANVFFTLRNAYVQELVWAGWVPLLIALGVSSGTGLVLQTFVNQYRGFGLIAPVLTGVAGNVGAIFVSRISTALHGAKEERYLLTAGTLFIISTPILMAFLAFVWLTGQARIGLAFAFSYGLLTCVVIGVSLAIAYNLTFWLWKRDYDPDINALPLLSSAVDLTGQLLLVCAFALASVLGGDVVLAKPVITDDGTVIRNATSAAADALRLTKFL